MKSLLSIVSSSRQLVLSLCITVSLQIFSEESIYKFGIGPVISVTVTGEIPPEDSEEKGTISMLYFRNGIVTLKEVWGPKAIAASAHANEAFTSVRNCADSKPRKPSDSSRGLGASKIEVESKKLSGLPAPKPTAALVGKEKQVCMYKIWGEDSPFPVTSPHIDRCLQREL